MEDIKHMMVTATEADFLDLELFFLFYFLLVLSLILFKTNNEKQIRQFLFFGSIISYLISISFNKNRSIIGIFFKFFKINNYFKL